MNTEVHKLFQYQFSVLLDEYLGVELLGFAFFFFFHRHSSHSHFKTILIQPIKHSSIQLNLFPLLHLPTSRKSCLCFLPSFTHSLLFPQLIPFWLLPLFCTNLYPARVTGNFQFPIIKVACWLNSIQHCWSILPSGNTIFPWTLYSLGHHISWLSVWSSQDKPLYLDFRCWHILGSYRVHISASL